MLAMVLAPYADDDVDITRATEILLVHDLVEIDAGDTYIYDEVGRESKEVNERAAAERIFNLLPSSQAAHIAELWDEYEERATPTAKFAYAIDRLQPLLLNSASGGVAWLNKRDTSQSGSGGQLPHRKRLSHAVANWRTKFSMTQPSRECLPTIATSRQTRAAVPVIPGRSRA